MHIQGSSLSRPSFNGGVLGHKKSNPAPARQPYIIGPVTTSYGKRGPVLNAFLYKSQTGSQAPVTVAPGQVHDGVIMLTPGGEGSKRHTTLRIGTIEKSYFGGTNPSDATDAAALIREGGTVYVSADGRIYAQAEPAKAARKPRRP
jgi:hypothetical protein